MKQFLITVAGVLVGLTLFAVTAPLLLVAAVAGWARPAGFGKEAAGRPPFARR